MKEFYLLPEFYKWHSRRMLASTLVFAAIVIPASLLIGTKGQISKSTITIIPLLLLLLAVGWIFGSINGKKSWESYCLIIDETSVTKKQKSYPDITIPFDKISKIFERPGKGLIILSHSTHKEIHVPTLISDYREILRMLQRSHVKIEILTNENSFAAIFITLIILVTFTITLLSDNIWVISITGIPSALFMLVSIINIQNNPNAPEFLKQWIWLTFFPIVTVILRISIGLIQSL